MGRGVFLVENRDDLQRYLSVTRTAYIQEYIPVDRDIRVVVIGKKAVLAYWRVAAPGEFRNNVSLGGRVVLDDVPAAAVSLAESAARKCGWDDVGIDVCRQGDRFLVLEANMKYGKEGFREAGIDYTRMMEEMIENDQL